MYDVQCPKRSFLLSHTQLFQSPLLHFQLVEAFGSGVLLLISSQSTSRSVPLTLDSSTFVANTPVRRSVAFSRLLRSGTIIMMVFCRPLDYVSIGKSCTGSIKLYTNATPPAVRPLSPLMWPRLCHLIPLMILLDTTSQLHRAC